jgi:hypothetical protein
MFYVHELWNLLRASNFPTPARPAGFENFRLWSIGGSGGLLRHTTSPPLTSRTRPIASKRAAGWTPNAHSDNSARCQHFRMIAKHGARAGSERMKQLAFTSSAMQNQLGKMSKIGKIEKSLYIQGRPARRSYRSYWKCDV